MSNTKSEKFKEFFSIIYLIASFGIIDVWLRVVTRWIGYYSIYEIAPNLFTVWWSILLTALVCIPNNCIVGRIIYAVTYYSSLVIALVQYGSYMILDKFLYVNDFMLAREGLDYTSYVWGFISVKLVICVLSLVVVGIIGIVILPCNYGKGQRKILFSIGGIVLSILGIIFTPYCYGEYSESWDNYMEPAYEYEQFTNSKFDLELAGLYQYMAKDLYRQVSNRFEDDSEKIEEINIFFKKKKNHIENDMTGIFKGKNVIVFMLESIDDWMITQKDTPTIYKMMNEGINFSNMYTPGYSNGYTFNTEFAFNTSVYPFSDGNAAYTLLQNTFSESIASIFAREGYSVNSFHEGKNSFYNRGEIHKVFGYEEYHSYRDYGGESIDIMNDIFLAQCDELYNDVVSGEKFFSFVITYSAHLPYSDADELTKIALKKYPEYDTKENREVSLARAKARLTDDMFSELLIRLKEDGMLEDTVIVGFADHYSFGITDSETLAELSSEAGSDILEKTPAFIYCAGLENPINVQKVMQTTDIAPTILNLLGLPVAKNIMGQDVFDDNYPGYAIFPNQTWITKEAYVKEGNVIWNNGMSEEEIEKMNIYVRSVYLVNDSILQTDYYLKE